MSTNRPVLTDEILREALLELATGPDAGDLAANVIRSVAATPQRGGLAWPLFDLGRRTSLILVAGLLLAALAAAVAVYSGVLPRPVPLPAAPSTVVTQFPDGLGGYVHTAFPPGSVTGAEIPVLTSNLPANAAGLRWSPDGSRLAYVTREAPTASEPYTNTGVFLANADGSDPIPLELAHPADDVFASGWWNGVIWAPSGELLAVEWVRTVCVGADCPEDGTEIYPHGIEIFDAAGLPVAGWDMGSDWTTNMPIWSPDSTAMGWLGYSTESCGFCHVFHWRTLTDDAVTSIPFPEGNNNHVTWSTDNRLLVSQYRSERGPAGNEGAITQIPERVYSMTPDGTDVQDVAWSRAQVPFWSPDGQMLVAVDPVAGQLIVLDLDSGDETVVSTPPGLSFEQWAPEGDRVMLVGNPADPGAGRDIDAAPCGPCYLYLAGVDGSDVLELGRAEDFGWMPASVSEGETPD
jgi:hypothetical protein